MSVNRVPGNCLFLLILATMAGAQARSGDESRSEKLATEDSDSRDESDITIREARHEDHFDVPTIYFLGDVLHIVGTPFHDRIVISQQGDEVAVFWGLASEYGGPADFWFETVLLESVGHLFVRTFEGNDHVFNMTGIDSTIYGGDQDDILVGGSSSDAIHGDDDLAVEPGFDILFGGFGVDWLFGGPVTDLLVGGSPFSIISPATGAYTPFPDYSFAELAYDGYFDDDGADHLWGGGPEQDFFIKELATDENGNSYSRDLFHDFDASDIEVFEN